MGVSAFACERMDSRVEERGGERRAVDSEVRDHVSS